MEDILFTPEISGSENLPDENEFLKFERRFKQMIMLYDSTIKLVTAQLEIMKGENKANGDGTAIRSVISRIKQPMSINKKLRKLGAPLTIDSIMENLNDVAGIRVICGYISDIYNVRDGLLKNGHLELIAEKDYIKNPKPNGYRSLHLILKVPLPLKGGLIDTKCEVQLRTTAMDTWAALEHQLRYKKDIGNAEEINQKLLRCANLLAETDNIMQEVADSIR